MFQTYINVTHITNKSCRLFALNTFRSIACTVSWYGSITVFHIFIAENIDFCCQLSVAVDMFVTVS